MNKLYIGNLPYSVNDASLEEMFAEFGNVVSAVVITDRQSGRSKGFGFVEYETDAEAAAAMEGMNEKEVDGRTIRVSEARPQQDR